MTEYSFSESYAGEAAQAAQDRRRYRRVRCTMPAELRPSRAGYPIQGETTDVSLGGCYVASIFPLPVGTAIEFRCWVDTVLICCNAIVRTSDPGVGNGIEFLDLGSHSAEILQEQLTKADATRRETEELSGVIRSRLQ